MVEEARVGGTCLHCGCIPAKELLQTAEVLRTVQGAAEFGVDAGQPTLDLADDARPASSRSSTGSTSGLETLLKGRKVTVVPGTGTIARRRGAPHPRLRRHRAPRSTRDPRDRVVAARARVPGFEFDGTRVLSSDHVLVLDEVPARVAIIGGGAIGCEFASFLADVGSEVTMLEAMPQVLPGVDKQVAQTGRAARSRSAASRCRPA